MNMRGIVLAGGKSSRFGDDKALAKLGNMTLIEHAVGVLKNLNLEVTVLTNSSHDYRFLNCPVHADLIPGKGPLGGLYTACVLYPEKALLVLTCDMPLVRMETVKQLIKMYAPHDEATLFCGSDGRVYPFPGVYYAGLVDLARACLEDEGLAMSDFIRKIEDIHMASYQGNEAVFHNVNERKDLDLCTRIQKI